MEGLQFFVDIYVAIWTIIQHLAYTLTFKDHWPHVLHDLAERRSQIPRNIGHMFYMTLRKDVPITQEHWPNDLHDSAERLLTIYNFLGREGDSNRSVSELKRYAMPPWRSG